MHRYFKTNGFDRIRGIRIILKIAQTCKIWPGWGRKSRPMIQRVLKDKKGTCQNHFYDVQVSREMLK